MSAFVHDLPRHRCWEEGFDQAALPVAVMTDTFEEWVAVNQPDLTILHIGVSVYPHSNLWPKLTTDDLGLSFMFKLQWL